MHESRPLIRNLLKSEAQGCLIAAVEALGRHQPFFTARMPRYLLDAYLDQPGPAPG